MKTDKFDVIVSSIRNTTPEPALSEEAAERVHRSLFSSAQVESAPPARLRSCADFQALIPEHLNRTLSPARSLLLVDHTHSCVACRHALESARSGNVRVLSRPQGVAPRVSPVTRWAIAAMVAAGVGFGSFAVVRSLSVPSGVRARVESVSGVLYQVADRSSIPVFPGRELSDRQIVRTAQRSTATLMLADGSSVEINERSQLSLSRGSRGNTIHLDRGNIIVHAAKQHDGALYVRTPDAEVMVKGTIFAVTSATKGSRVSVVEGSVQVAQNGQTQLLKPGGQTTSSRSMAAVPVQDDFAWSQDSAKYLAVLGSLSSLQKDIEQIPSPALRTSSKLLDYMPDNTVLYAAMPNIGSSLAQADQLFEDRIQSDAALREWWTAQGNQTAQVHDMVQKIRAVSEYLGDEVAVAFTDGAPIVMAETKRDGLDTMLQSQFGSGTAGKFVLTHGMVAVSSKSGLLDEFSARAANPVNERSGGLRSRVEQAYQSGVGWLLCADLKAIRKPAPSHFSALTGVRYLTFERKEINGETRNTATLAFAQHRGGLNSWLAAPAAMSTLDFVSPDASFATSFVINNPGALLTQLLQQAASNPAAEQALSAFQSETGVNIASDIAPSLGGELTFAIDGPLVPLPSWKLAVEVYSPDRLEWAIEQIVKAANQQPNSPVKLQFSNSQVNGLTYYKIVPTGANVPAGFEIDYVFSDSYLIAAANAQLLTTALQNKATGYTLARSQNFRNLFPNDANPNFSAIVYHNVGGLVGTLADRLKSSAPLTDQQKQAMDALKTNSAPGLIYAYAEPDKITISANGSLFGFSLDSLALPKIMESLKR